MSGDFNNVTIIGRLTRTPELKNTASGTAICSFSLAVNDRARGQEQYVNYIDCNLWGKQAEDLAPHLMQGLQVCVSGRLRQNRWEKDGQKRSKIELNVNSFQFLASPKGSGGQPLATPQQHGGFQSFQDDVPF